MPSKWKAASAPNQGKNKLRSPEATAPMAPRTMRRDTSPSAVPILRPKSEAEAAAHSDEPEPAEASPLVSEINFSLNTTLSTISSPAQEDTQGTPRQDDTPIRLATPIHNTTTSAPSTPPNKILGLGTVSPLPPFGLESLSVPNTPMRQLHFNRLEEEERRLLNERTSPFRNIIPSSQVHLHNPYHVPGMVFSTSPPLSPVPAPVVSVTSGNVPILSTNINLNGNYNLDGNMGGMQNLVPQQLPNAPGATPWRPSHQLAQPQQPPKEASKQPIDPTKYKTKMCRNFERTGICSYEHTCCFAHGPEELRHPNSAIEEPKTTRPQQAVGAPSELSQQPQQQPQPQQPQQPVMLVQLPNGQQAMMMMQPQQQPTYMMTPEGQMVQCVQMQAPQGQPQQPQQPQQQMQAVAQPGQQPQQAGQQPMQMMMMQVPAGNQQTFQQGVPNMIQQPGMAPMMVQTPQEQNMVQGQA